MGASSRRSRRADGVALLGSLNIHVDDRSPAIETVVALSRERNLSACDALFLELAMREGIPLATLDGSMKLAAEAAGVRLVIR